MNMYQFLSEFVPNRLASFIGSSARLSIAIFGVQFEQVSYPHMVLAAITQWEAFRRLIDLPVYLQRLDGHKG